MELNRISTLGVVIALLCTLLPSSAYTQCSYYPVAVEQRVAHSEYIVLGRLKSQHCYWDRTHSIINTLNIIEVSAWLKGYQNKTEIGIITRGGVLEDEAMISHPSLEIFPWNEYVFFLQGDNAILDHPDFRISRPDLIQAETYADAQGALTKQSGYFHDLLVMPKQTEAELFALLENLIHESPRNPKGHTFSPREGDTYPLSSWTPGNFNADRQAPITSFSPSPTNAGTIVPADFITITGSGFGAAAGTVFYTNADDGGATFTATGFASDNVSWSDAAIQNKPARSAGTGPINVNGAMTSGSNLAITYSHININNNFSGFSSTTRQRYYLRNLNSAGGYTFTYNTTFNADALATAAFRRAVNTWRCATFVNWSISGSTTAVATATNDGVNCVFYNGGLPAGVLGRATSSFSGSANAGCNLTNTVWYTADIDVEFMTNPPTAGFNWEYGPAAPSFTEYDFESVAVHELGHAHGLGHVISVGAVMHFAISNGTSARNPNANEISGGNAKMGYSTTATCFNPTGSGTPMVALTAGTCALAEHNLVLSGEHVPDSGNRLQWNISDEDHITGFEIQRHRGDGNFASIGQVASQVQADGNYSFLDPDMAHYPISYYRIKLLDLQGQGELSDVVAIRISDAAEIEVFPTLVHDALFIRGYHASSGDIQFRLLDAQGRSVLLEPLTTQDGYIAQRIGLQGIAQGMYWYRIEGAGLARAGKIMRMD